MLRAYVILSALCMPVYAMATDYDCKVEKKIGSEAEYTASQIAKWQFSVKIEERSGDSFFSRCSYSERANKITCDRYEIDNISFDENVKIKKYYHFRSHFDIQIFSDLSFIENNGRGAIGFGQCRVVAP